MCIDIHTMATVSDFNKQPEIMVYHSKVLRYNVEMLTFSLREREREGERESKVSNDNRLKICA